MIFSLNENFLDFKFLTSTYNYLSRIKQLITQTPGLIFHDYSKPSFIFFVIPDFVILKISQVFAKHFNWINVKNSILSKTRNII